MRGLALIFVGFSLLLVGYVLRRYRRVLAA